MTLRVFIKRWVAKLLSAPMGSDTDEPYVPKVGDIDPGWVASQKAPHLRLVDKQRKFVCECERKFVCECGAVDCMKDHALDESSNSLRDSVQVIESHCGSTNPNAVVECIDCDMEILWFQVEQFVDNRGFTYLPLCPICYNSRLAQNSSWLLITSTT